MVGVAGNTITNYEKEQHGISVELIHKFCDLYGVTADYLLCRSNNPHPVISAEDAALLAAYHSSPAEIRAIIDTALEPYKQENQDAAAAS